jgi:hypothetical protein
MDKIFAWAAGGLAVFLVAENNIPAVKKAYYT